MLLLILYAIGQVLDGSLTYIGLSRGFTEGNPIGVFLFNQIGVIPGLMLMKGVGIWMGYIMYKHNARRVLGLMTMLMYAICVLPWILLLCFGKP